MGLILPHCNSACQAETCSKNLSKQGMSPRSPRKRNPECLLHVCFSFRPYGSVYTALVQFGSVKHLTCSPKDAICGGLIYGRLKNSQKVKLSKLGNFIRHHLLQVYKSMSISNIYEPPGEIYFKVGFNRRPHGSGGQ